MSDPNEGNPFEPPETPEQRQRRVDREIRESVDRKIMFPRSDVAWLLTKENERLREAMDAGEVKAKALDKFTEHVKARNEDLERIQVLRAALQALVLATEEADNPGDYGVSSDADVMQAARAALARTQPAPEASAPDPLVVQKQK